VRPDLELLRRLLPPGSLLDSEADLAVYSYDAALDRARPQAVALPRSVEDVSRIIEFCVLERIPFTARGAGTNLSGGCIPLRGGIVLSLARMDKILEIDTARGFALVEPGVVNLSLQKELEKINFFYAPDPASFRVSTIGGNIAENAGGPRCLKYGTTTNHVLALEVIMPDGSLQRFSLEDQGPEIMSLLVGSEGTLGVVTKAWVKITPIPENIVTFLAGFPSLEKSVECVAEIIAAGILPRVLEVLDKTTVDSVEAYAHAGYPRSEAVLLAELDGPAPEVGREAGILERLCCEHGARDFRAATSPAQREKLWEGRRGAYAAMARLAPNVLVEDGVVPRNQLPEIVRRIQEICSRRSVTVGLLFHAGDGNIHPNIAYDERDAEQTRQVKAAGYEILQACVDLGGSLSGEHGIGIDKREAMGWLFTPQSLELFCRIKKAIDPNDLANPDKVLPLKPDPGGRQYRRPPSKPLSSLAQGLVEKVRECRASGLKMAVCGRGTRLSVPEGLICLETVGLDRILDLDRGNYTLTVECGILPQRLIAELAAQNIFLRLPNSGGTLGGLLAAKAAQVLRDDLLGMRLLLADGSVVEFGGKVVKNVAGYDVSRLILGSWGTLGVILDVTLKIYSRLQGELRADNPRPFQPGPWQRNIKQAFDPENFLNPWLFPEKSLGPSGAGISPGL
jgi:glycolate oxidase subunit GlcD